MNRDLILAFIAVVLGACGTSLLLPHSHGTSKPRNVHATGITLAISALIVLSLIWTAPGPFVSGMIFYLCAFGAVGSGVLMVVSRDPIHSALWFASVVLATTGLFVLAGAQFLAVGTVIVYAGAIIVTFLFVIMLAQMEGRAAYDRSSRSPFAATWTCFVLLFGVLWALFHVNPRGTPGVDVLLGSTLERTSLLKDVGTNKGVPGIPLVVKHAVRPTAELSDDKGRLKPHVAGLGETLYTDHLITVEIVGALLFAALIGAIAIAAPKTPIRPGNRRTENAAV